MLNLDRCYMREAMVIATGKWLSGASAIPVEYVEAATPFGSQVETRAADINERLAFQQALPAAGPNTMRQYL